MRSLLPIFCVCFFVTVQSFAKLTCDINCEWENFKRNYKKSYKDRDVEGYRKRIWMENLKMIREHNKEKHSFKLHMNHLGDLTLKEYKALMLGSLPKKKDSVTLYKPPSNFPLPLEVDWRKKGYVTRVKDQGECGSCWAFSATGSLEGQHFKKTGQLVALSEQNLVDCSTENHGCNGGWPNGAYEYVIANGGIDTEASYSYKDKYGKCHYKTAENGAKCTGFEIIKPNSESELQYAIADIGPISGSIDASSHHFQFYSSGVYDESSCSSTNLDHAVLIVGYGTTKDGKKYWLVKNSWGTQWGEKGYILMSRNKKNQCGIATAASFPRVSDFVDVKHRYSVKRQSSRAVGHPKFQAVLALVIILTCLINIL